MYWALGSPRETFNLHGNHFSTVVKNELENETWQRCSWEPFEKTTDWLFRIFWCCFGQNLPENSKNVQMCRLEQKNTRYIFQKRPMRRFFVWSWKNPLPNFAFLLVSTTVLEVWRRKVPAFAGISFYSKSLIWWISPIHTLHGIYEYLTGN